MNWLRTIPFPLQRVIRNSNNCWRQKEPKPRTSGVQQYIMCTSDSMYSLQSLVCFWIQYQCDSIVPMSVSCTFCILSLHIDVDVICESYILWFRWSSLGFVSLSYNLHELVRRLSEKQKHEDYTFLGLLTSIFWIAATMGDQKTRGLQD